MNQIIKIFLLLFIVNPVYSQSKILSEADEFEYYKSENNKETRLSEFKDNDEALRIKLIQINIINNSRNRYRAGPVKLDILASRVANKMCKEAAENEYVGHWNMAGEKPYHRYAFAGGYDHITENAFGEWSSENYINSWSGISAMMKLGHESFMAEKSPNDGHKRTIIDESHNYVGIGFFLGGNQFRYYEEFIDRHFEFENIPGSVKIGEPCSITVKTTDESYIYFMIIYREQFPSDLTPAQLMRKGSYNDYTDEIYLQSPSWDIAQYKDGDTYKIPLTFSKEGLYYIHLYYDNKEILKPSSLNTRGKTPVSGIVIRVYK